MRTSCLTVGITALALLGAGTAGAEPGSFAYGQTRMCPANDSSGFNAKKLRGRRLIVARELALRYGCSLRVVERNGRPLAVTDDLRRNRINVGVRGPKKRVVKVFPTG